MYFLIQYLPNTLHRKLRLNQLQENVNAQSPSLCHPGPQPGDTEFSTQDMAASAGAVAHAMAVAVHGCPGAIKALFT